MRELSQIRDAVVSALAAEGVAALDAYPDQRARRYGCPVAAVAVETAESRTVGFCNYLGEVFDTGGRRTAGAVWKAAGGGDLHRDPGDSGLRTVRQGCETAAEVLLGRLPAGIRPGELNWEALTWEKETGHVPAAGKAPVPGGISWPGRKRTTRHSWTLRLKGVVTT